MKFFILLLFASLLLGCSGKPLAVTAAGHGPTRTRFG